jgi:hypothetical protein
MKRIGILSLYPPTHLILVYLNNKKFSINIIIFKAIRVLLFNITLLHTFLKPALNILKMGENKNGIAEI